jgi:hypothetical protein
MSKRHTVTLHYVITIHNNIFDHLDGVMLTLAKKNTQWKEDVFCALKFSCQMLSKYYSEVTPESGMLLIAAHILDSFQTLRSFRTWDKAMDVNPEDDSSFTA